MELPELDTKLGELGKRVNEIGEEIRSLVEKDTADSKARIDELHTEQNRIREEVEPLVKEREEAALKASVADTQKSLEALLASSRAPSKATAFGTSRAESGEYVAGQFIGALVDLADRDPEVHAKAKATLQGFSGGYESAWGKAALGSTAATGGWIIPNSIVDTLIKPAAFRNYTRQVCTIVSGVTAPSVDIPFRSAAPAAALVIPFGQTKTNVDLAYNGYTATMYTLAKIHDIGNQFLRQSRGAAEQDVMQELAHAFALAERKYVIEGTGSSEPYGLQTALTNAPATFTSTHTPAATLAGSISTAIATAAGALAGRNREPNAAVVHSSTYWAMLAEGTDEAGFFFNPAAGPTGIAGVPAGTLISPFGIPVYADSQLTNTDDLIVGDFSALKVYLGQSYRVDSSDVAGTRWDTNLTGFRGELELGCDARPAVYAGAFQRVDDVIA